MAEPPAASVRWCDSHCHLQDRYVTEAGFDDAGRDGLSAVLASCREAGVERVVCVGTDAASSKEALALAAEVAHRGALPEVFATVGLHPHGASAGVEEVAGLVTSARSSEGGGPAPVAVGECGLDYHYDHAPRPEQRRAFAEQIALAHRHRLALVVHAREAWDDLFDILAAEGVPERAVLHCFTGGPAEARRGLEAGMWLSFSGIVTFKNAAEVREAAALCPEDRLLVETDSPFLAPVPHRGRPNRPSLVPLVGATVARVRGVSTEAVAEASWRNATALFGLDGP